jgi:protein-S-isoprenylcysteine O-methyltransferase Ste14
MVATARSAIGLCWIAFIVVWVIAARSTKPTVEQPRNQIVYRIFWLAAFVLLFLGGPRNRRPIGAISKVVFHVGTDLAFVGLVLAVCGLVLALWARATLGKNWSGQITFKEDHTLVQHGPYRFVRHPIYTAILLMFAGSAVAYGTVGAILGFPLALIGFVIKARQEEALMQKHFPDAYPDYRSRTHMLVPGVF